MLNLNSEQEKLALFRFSVIAPLVCRSFESSEERRATRNEILGKLFKHPNGEMSKVPERTLRWWLQRYKAASLAGLCDGMNQPRKNKGTCTAISVEVLDAAEALRREVPSRTVPQLLKLLESVHGVQPESLCGRTLGRQLKLRGVTRKKLERGDGYFQRREARQANEMWQGDTSFAVWLPDPQNPNKNKRTKLIAFIDDATRVCTHAEFYFDEKLPNVVDAFGKAMLKRGKPGQLLLDNGSNYRSLLMEGMCAQLEIELSFCKPRRPQGKGKIERWFRTLKESFIPEASRAGTQSLDELNRQLQAWIEQEYHAREHSELKQSPQERWALDQDKLQYVCADDVRRALMIRERRRVHQATSTVVLDCEEYQVSPSYAGETVEVRWHPDRIEEIEIWHEGTFVEIAQLITRPSHVQRKKELDEEERHDPLSSSKAYMKSLSSKFSENAIPNVILPELLTQEEFVCLVQDKMSRTLRPKELDDLRIFFLRFAPLSRDIAEKAVRQAVEAKGGALHVRVIVQHLQLKIQSERK